MEAIRIRTHLNSETVTLPELKPFIGQDVEISVETVRTTAARQPVLRISPLSQSERLALWEKLGAIELDEEAIWNLREVSKL